MIITVEGMSGAAYRITIGAHEVVVDQPLGSGGEDRGPTPTDLFVGGLASCAAFYAGLFLRRRGYPPESVRVRCTYSISHSQPARVDSIELTLDLPTGLSDDQREAALRAADHCTVHNTLRQPPNVSITLGSGEAVPAGVA